MKCLLILIFGITLANAQFGIFDGFRVLQQSMPFFQAATKMLANPRMYSGLSNFGNTIQTATRQFENPNFPFVDLNGNDLNLQIGPSSGFSNIFNEKPNSAYYGQRPSFKYPEIKNSLNHPSVLLKALNGPQLNAIDSYKNRRE